MLIHCHTICSLDRGISIIWYSSIKPFQKCVHNYEYEAKHQFLKILHIHIIIEQKSLYCYFRSFTGIDYLRYDWSWICMILWLKLAGTKFLTFMCYMAQKQTILVRRMFLCSQLLCCEIIIQNLFYLQYNLANSLNIFLTNSYIKN